MMAQLYNKFHLQGFRSRFIFPLFSQGWQDLLREEGV